jgi:hypothetical protein
VGFMFKTKNSIQRVEIAMLDFFLVLGQIPGTKFYLTFTELFSTYSICLTVYILHREYHLRKNFLIYMRLVYIMYSTRVLPGRIKQRVILTERINLVPLIRSDFENFWKSLQDFAQRVHLSVERIVQFGSSLRHPTSGAF